MAIDRSTLQVQCSGMSSLPHLRSILLSYCGPTQEPHHLISHGQRMSPETLNPQFQGLQTQHVIPYAMVPVYNIVLYGYGLSPMRIPQGSS